MNTTESRDKRKSFFITVLIYLSLLLALFFIRFWPPADSNELMGGGGGGGIEMNFGDSDLGSGADFKSEVLEVKNQAKAAPTPTTPDENVITNEDENSSDVYVPKKEPVKKSVVVPVKKETKFVEEKPKVSKNANDALANILNGNNKGGDGDDKVAGNKGKSGGNLNSNEYYGQGGSGGGTGGGTGSGNGTGTGPGSGSGSGGGSGSGVGTGSGYALGNRKALVKPTPNYACNEQGKVVVEVTVDRNGKTIGAIAGIRGTTNTAKCLLDQARIAALNTKWQASDDAPEKQVGSIVYNFNLN